MLVLPVWSAIGFLIYFGYSRRHSHLGQGRIEVHETEIHDIAPASPGSTTSIRTPSAARAPAHRKEGEASASPFFVSRAATRRARCKSCFGPRAIMLDDFGGGDRAERQRRLERRARALRRRGSPRRTSRPRRWCRPAARSARRGHGPAHRRARRSRPARRGSRPRSAPAPRSPSTAASKSPAPVSAKASASLANRMSIAPSSIKRLRSARWRSTTKLSDKVKATLVPAARARSIALRIAARGSSGSHK